jgi:hypothetical protein
MRRILLVLFVLAVAAPASAQSIWLDREHRPSIMAEQFFPSFDGADSGFPTWTWFLTGKLPLGDEGTSVVLELPYAHGEFGDEPFTDSEGSIGNPYVGLEYRPHPTGLILEAGGRLPLASDEKFIPFIVGYYTDVERQEAFVPDQIPLRIGFHYHHAPSDAGTPISWDLRLVPSVWIVTDDEDGLLEESEFFFGYGGLVRYEGETARVGGGITGRWNATNDNADFGEASVHQLDLGADFLRGSVRPGIQVKLPLDDGLSNFVDVSWGFTVTVLP